MVKKIEMDITDILRMLAQNAQEEAEEDLLEVEVGTLDEKLIKEKREVDHRKKDLEEEMELRAKELELKFKREARRILDPLKEEREKVHQAFWNKVYEVYNLDPKHDYYISRKTYKIYQYVDKPEIDEENSVLN